MNHSHSLRHLHLGCGESLCSRLPGGLAPAAMRQRARRNAKKAPRSR